MLSTMKAVAVDTMKGATTKARNTTNTMILRTMTMDMGTEEAMEEEEEEAGGILAAVDTGAAGEGGDALVGVAEVQEAVAEGEEDGVTPMRMKATASLTVCRQ